ncbi:hypothetical protein MC885_018515 [Smutsia gigantea]|nr:hypothetical protein MC885_018515 [Smutsia gigantea]
MEPKVPWAPPALWVLGCFVLLLCLWALCTACHSKQAQRHQARLQGSVMPAEVSLLGHLHLCSLSKSDSRLHELCRGPRGCRAPRPASMDLLCPQWMEVSRGSTRPLAAFSNQELSPAMPTAIAVPSIGPEATYSNVGLAAITRASLAASPVVWAGAQLTSSCARPGPEARPMVAEYACIQKLKGTDLGPQGLEQGKAEATPAVQVDVLYSRVSKPKRRDPGSATDQPDLKGRASILAPGSDLAYGALPLRGLGMDNGLLENVASPGKSQLDEVIAAAALTSLSSSRFLLGAPTAACSPEPGLEPWREGFVLPPGSCSWSWDLASEQSSPSTPSPPLPPEAAHFLFGEPARRKRKNSVQALFQCLWKQCGKVLSTASGMQRHVRLVHLGCGGASRWGAGQVGHHFGFTCCVPSRRQEEPEQSDGEEDFYYTELDAGVDTLTDGRSSLTPVSPVASMPPAFPHLGLPEAPALLPPPVMGSAVPPKVCHSDHAYWVGEVTGRTWGPVSGRSRGEQVHSCASSQDCMGPVHPEPQLSTFRACKPALPSKLGASPRKPQSDARKCRKVYGTDRRDLWCTACRWKKACRRLPD